MAGLRLFEVNPERLPLNPLPFWVDLYPEILVMQYGEGRRRPPVISRFLL